MVLYQMILKKGDALLAKVSFIKEFVTVYDRLQYKLVDSGFDCSVVLNNI